MSPRRGAAITAAGAAALAAFWLSRAPFPPAFLQVVARLDHPVDVEGAKPPSNGARAAARYRWTAGEIDGGWTRARSEGSVTLRSPRIDLPPDALYSIAVALPPATSIERAVLLWSGSLALSREDYVRNRRDLSPRAGRSSVLEIRGKDLRGTGAGGDTSEPVRYLFLHLPDAGATRDVVESIAVVTTSDLMAASGRARVLAGGEAHDVVFSGGHPVSYPLDLATSGELLLGVRGEDSEKTIRAQAVLVAGGRETVLVDRSVPGGAWREFRTPLPAAHGAVLRLSAGTNTTDSPVYWSTPLVLGPEDRSGRPNVVLYVVDALRASRLGLYGSHGSPRSISPVLDDLGRRGLVFRRAYTAATWTKPAIASLLTSLYPQTHTLGARYFGDPLPDSVVTLQDALRAQGYVTAQFSANAFAGTLSNLDKGFDWSFMPEAFGGATKSGERHKVGADELNRRILPWIGEHRDQRFFLYVHSVDTHPPFIAPGSRKARDPLAAYDAAIAFNDREIGRLYRRLVDLHLDSRTLFIVTADHGEAFGEHGQRGHGVSVYEEEARVPLIVHGPGRVTPGRVEEPVSLVDLFPTILDYCGVPADPSAQGRSLVPRSGTAAAPRPVFVTRFVYPEDLDAASADRAESHAVVAFPWKLIATDAAGGSRRFELYDLDRDPLERQDRASSEPAEVRRLDALLDEFLREQTRRRALYVAAHGSGQGGLGWETRARLPSDEALKQLRSLGYLH